MEPYSLRRARLAQQIRERGGGVAVVFTAPEGFRNRDADYPYRWDSYFYYLTGFPEPQAALVLSVRGDHDESLLFCRDKNAEREIWDGHRYGPAMAAERFGFDRAHSIEELDTELVPLLADQPTLYCPLGSDESIDARVRSWIGAVRAQARTGIAAPSQAIDVCTLLDEMRLFKDDHEVQIMRRAAQISAQAHVRAMQATRPGMYEYQVEAELLHEFRRHGSQFPAYGSIVAGGRNACVLHYRGNDAQLSDGELLLIDEIGRAHV